MTLSDAWYGDSGDGWPTRGNGNGHGAMGNGSEATPDTQPPQPSPLPPAHCPLPGPISRREQVELEMLTAHLNRLAIHGGRSTRGAEGYNGAPGAANVDDLVVRTIDAAATLTRDQREVLHAVSRGRHHEDRMRALGWSIERSAAREGDHPFAAIRDIYLARALLALMPTEGTLPLTLIQAEICAGVRDFDGELVRDFAGWTRGQ